MNLEIIRRDDGEFSVLFDGKMAPRLIACEVQDEVVRWLYGLPTVYSSLSYPRYEWLLDDDVPIAGLLTDQRVTGSTSMATYVPRPPIREVVREKQWISDYA